MTPNFGETVFRQDDFFYKIPTPRKIRGVSYLKDFLDGDHFAGFTELSLVDHTEASISDHLEADGP